MSKGIAALDLSTRTGWARYMPGRADGPEVESGVHQMPVTGEDVGTYLLDFAGWLARFLQEEPLAGVVFEAPIMPNDTQMATLRKLYGLAGLTEMTCKRLGIAVWEVHAGTVRKHFLGVGGGKSREWFKAKTMEVCRLTGWDPKTHDEADALAILDYTAHTLKIERSWSRADRLV